MLLDFVFVVLIFRHRNEVLKIQFGMLAVLVLVTAETSAWSIAFATMNTSGTPACCPYPPALVAAVILQMLRKTVCRVLLLVVCLGLGMVYPTLDKRQTILVLLLSVAYLGFGLGEKVEQVTISNDQYNTDAPQFSMYGLLEVRACRSCMYLPLHLSSDAT